MQWSRTTCLFSSNHHGLCSFGQLTEVTCPQGMPRLTSNSNNLICIYEKSKSLHYVFGPSNGSFLSRLSHLIVERFRMSPDCVETIELIDRNFVVSSVLRRRASREQQPIIRCRIIVRWIFKFLCSLTAAISSCFGCNRNEWHEFVFRWKYWARIFYDNSHVSISWCCSSTQ